MDNSRPVKKPLGYESDGSDAENNESKDNSGLTAYRLRRNKLNIKERERRRGIDEDINTLKMFLPKIFESENRDETVLDVLETSNLFLSKLMIMVDHCKAHPELAIRPPQVVNSQMYQLLSSSTTYGHMVNSQMYQHPSSSTTYGQVHTQPPMSFQTKPSGIQCSSKTPQTVQPNGMLTSMKTYAVPQSTYASNYSFNQMGCKENISGIFPQMMPHASISNNSRDMIATTSSMKPNNTQLAQNVGFQNIQQSSILPKVNRPVAVAKRSVKRYDTLIKQLNEQNIATLQQTANISLVTGKQSKDVPLPDTTVSQTSNVLPSVDFTLHNQTDRVKTPVTGTLRGNLNYRQVHNSQVKPSSSTSCLPHESSFATIASGHNVMMTCNETKKPNNSFCFDLTKTPRDSRSVDVSKTPCNSGLLSFDDPKPTDDFRTVEVSKNTRNATSFDFSKTLDVSLNSNVLDTPSRPCSLNVPHESSDSKSCDVVNSIDSNDFGVQGTTLDDIKQLISSDFFFM